MIGTSHRGPIQRSVFCCVSVHSPKWRAMFMNGNPPLHCPSPAVYIHGPDGKWLKTMVF
ncbi:unnamed protein product [Staurois parvus]|uniref:Uncharacterized protein n=1 Tax=Staurois parvus TaxID=386267 RepID=A0ABN9F822_9NEOB|nr:unnamed protein product [Staurois parvus]